MSKKVTKKVVPRFYYRILFHSTLPDKFMHVRVVKITNNPGLAESKIRNWTNHFLTRSAAVQAKDQIFNLLRGDQ